MDQENDAPQQGLEPRAPTLDDLSNICGILNDLGASYIVIGGWSVIGLGYPRATMDVDFVIDPSVENVAKVYKALETLPDKAVLELEPHEVAEYTVVRVGDEITVDLMASAGGYDYEAVSEGQIIREINGVPIPFASPKMLYKMKELTYREKDRGDLQFLRENYAAEIFGDPENPS